LFVRGSHSTSTSTIASSGFLYLIVVVVAAVRGGFGQATVTSIIAVVCLNYFFVPPTFTFVVADPENWVALGAFEFTALIVSRLSHRAQTRAAEAIAERHDSERLYEISRRILLLDRSRDPGAIIPALIREAFGLSGVVLFDALSASIHSSGESSQEEGQRARDAYYQNSDKFDANRNAWFCALRLGGRPLGGLALCGCKLTPLIATAIASLSAIALERARSLEKEYHAEAARQIEQLRTAVLDALAHEFKTPLTVISTASSGLLAAGNLSNTEMELVSLIDDQSKELTYLANRLLGAARLDRADFKPQREPLLLSNLVKDVIENIQDEQCRGRFRISLPDHESLVAADRKLIESALAQLLDNAIKYSLPGSPIDIELAVSTSEVILTVRDQGLLIPPADRERIFERFYRAAGTEQWPVGTGLGLSIVRRVVDAHHGRVWAESDPERGTAFSVALPVAPSRPQEQHRAERF
jgi:two-component system, OmpR family, sensor histidine kinase KdpD